MKRYGKVLSKDMLFGEANDRYDEKYEGRICYITINKDGTVYGENGSTVKSQEEIYF